MKADVVRLRARPTSRRRPPSYWTGIWAAWCPTCEQEAMPMPSGRCGWCDTNLAGQPTRRWFEPPLRGPGTPEHTGEQNHELIAA
jgi:hypothetical protein